MFDNLILKTNSAKKKTFRYIILLIFLYSFGSNIPYAYFTHK
jgi:hypothetical protein